MKKLMLYIVALFLTATIVSSCASPRYGCPGSTQNYRPLRD